MICSTCDEVVTDPHIHNVWRLYHPALIEQRPVTGLDLQPMTFAVLTFAAWIDMNMQHVYYQRTIYPSVGLS